MGYTGVNISKVNSNTGKVATPDNVGLLIIGGAVATENLAVKTATKLLSIGDAEALGITASYDDFNSILAYHHIDEFFRIAPNGNLYIVLDDGTLTADDLKSIFKNNQDISFFGVVRNSSTAPEDFAAFVSGYQNIIIELRAEQRLISSGVVEGVEYDANKLIGDYPDMRELEASNMSVVIAQDPAIRNIKSAYETYAAVGTALGAIAVRKVNENIGSVNIENKPDAYKGTLDYSLTDIGRGRWLSAVLQSGKNFNDLSINDIKALNDKGYLIVGSYNGYPGYFFNDSHTCTAVTSDYARIENNRVWDKAALLIRTALLPKVKSNIDKDPTTGTIDSLAATDLEKYAEEKVSQMVSAKECSGVGIYIDNDQSLSDGNPLIVSAKVVHNDIIHEFDVQLSLTDKL